MKHKSFDQKLHDSVDPQSRRSVIQYFRTQGIELKSNPDQYGIDLISPSGHIKIELEYRGRYFTGSYFAFDSINLPSRKRKFVMDDSAHYAIVNDKFDYMLICKNADIKRHQASLREVSNKEIPEGEFFYELPKSIFKLVKLS